MGFGGYEVIKKGCITATLKAPPVGLEPTTL